MSVEKNQLFKVGDKVKILPTILTSYPDFPYVGVVGRVCAVVNSDVNIGVEFSTPCDYLHNCDGAAESHSGWWCLRKELEFIPDDNLPDIWEYIK
jgi:hypothetical protein